MTTATLFQFSPSSKPTASSKTRPTGDRYAERHHTATKTSTRTAMKAAQSAPPVVDELEESDQEVEDSVAEDMRRLEESFEGISERFRLINRIGEGTFSTVYKAEDLLYDRYDNGWDIDAEENQDPRATKRRRTERDNNTASPVKSPRRAQYVALKKIYVTSSPLRIQNELELLFDLRGCKSVCPLITAFRHQDQVVAVLPYFRHTDFRAYYRKMEVEDMRPYFRSLLTALHAVHKHGILHRDIKPTNFLYNVEREQGVLVDFGLAEREGTDWAACICCKSPSSRTRIFDQYSANAPKLSTGYPKADSRPSRRANRAGTRGFRAPEVLLKCTSQTTKIDIWSAGVILLTILGRRFPFFNSADDIDAMIEIATIFGQKRMKAVAALHGQVFETTIPTIGREGYSWEKIVTWAASVEELSPAEKQACAFLAGLMDLDPAKRWSAKEALQHEFFTRPIGEEGQEAEVEEQEQEDVISEGATATDEDALAEEEKTVTQRRGRDEEVRDEDEEDEDEMYLV